MNAGQGSAKFTYVTLSRGAMWALKGYEALMDERARDRRRADLPGQKVPTRLNRNGWSDYALRNRIECCFGHLKNARRVATGYDKLVENFSGFVDLIANSYSQHLPPPV